MTVTGRRAQRIEQWPVERLKPYERNAKIHSPAQVAQIAESIKRFGFNNPILVDSQDGIIAGHGRFAAAQELGLREVPVIVLDHLTDAERRAYIIADNRIAENAEWDSDILTAELAALNDEEFDLGALGFSDRELERMLATDADGRADECPVVPDIATSQPGDLWLLGRHRLLCGDATSADDVARLMDGRKADMVFTDPPYGVNFSGAKYNPRAKAWAGIANDDRNGLDLRGFLCDVFGRMIAASAEAAPVYIWSVSMQEGYETLKALKECDIHIQSQLVWVKNTLVLGQADYQWKHDICWYGWTPGERHYWDGGRALTTVWEQSKDANASYVHPMQKPVSLARFAIKNSCRRDGSVLDLFGGSGSTLIACEQSGRDARLMEIEPKYCDVIVTRWQEYTSQAATLDGDGRTFAVIAEERRA